ncbi:MAG: ATP-dependent Clp protease proteolytic subunit, partial [Oscillospiraceae bacterium]|nr:ATP-dependent Clp protease proteolytic subunit [Oscillospiraceae bacterium]
AYEDKTHLSRTRLSHLMDEETWFSAKKAKQLGFVDGILFSERKLPDEEEPEEEESEPKENRLPSMTYSPSKTMSSFLQKVSANTTTGTPVAQLEKRLELLKY